MFSYLTYIWKFENNIWLTYKAKNKSQKQTVLNIHFDG